MNDIFSDDQLFSLARAGIEAESFLRTSLGKDIIETAEIEVRRARDALEKVDPDDPGAVRRAQFAVAVPRRALEWLLGIVEMGAEAHRQLRDKEESVDG